MKNDIGIAMVKLVTLSIKAEELVARSMLTQDRQIALSQNELNKIAQDLRFVLNCLGGKP